jgi:hypothetical protein
MGTLFVFGVFWFWVLLVVAGIILTVITELDDTNQYGLLVLVALGFALYHGGNHVWFNDLFHDIANDPGKYLMYFGGYIVVGIIWSFIKWYFYLIELKEERKGKSSSYFTRSGDVSENKERILNWMIYWPLSAFWTIINQPIRRLFKYIYRGIEGRYQKMSDKILNVNKTTD